MRTNVTIVLAAGLALLCLVASTTTAAAQTYSCVWGGLALDDKPTICPAGDGPAYITVTLLDGSGVGMDSETVEVYYVTNCVGRFCPPSTAITNATGQAEIYPHGGFDRSSDAGCCEVTTIVEYNGEPINWPATGLTFDQREWRCFDLTGDFVVDMTDYTLLGGDFYTEACRSDFNGDGTIESTDQTFIIPHAMGAHQCTPLPPPGIEVNPTSLEFALAPGEEACVTVTVSNVATMGGAGLVWFILEIPSFAHTGLGEPIFGRILPGDSNEFDLCVRSEGLLPGEYDGEIRILHSAPSEANPLLIPVHLEVLDVEPDIEVDPMNLELAVPYGGSDCATFTIGNTGDGDLTWEASSACPWVTEIDPTGEVVTPPDNWEDVQVCVSATGLLAGDHYCDINVESDDPDESLVVVTAHLNVEEPPDIEVTPAEFFISLIHGTEWTFPDTIANEGAGTLVWEAFPSIEYVSVAPAGENEIPPDGETEAQMTLTASWDLEPGILHEWNIAYESNDPVDPVFNVPVTLAIAPAPRPEVSATEFEFEVGAGGDECQLLEISNTGSADLEWTITIPIECDSWLWTDPIEGLTPPGEVSVVDVCVDTEGLAPGPYECEIEIETNEPERATIVILVTLQVQMADMANSHVDWINLECTDKVFVCPWGDGSAITVSVRDVNDAPIAGVQVVPFFEGTCEGCICEPISVVTDALGTATMLTTTMFIGGQPIPWLGTGLPSDTREFRSPDLNGDCTVDVLDNTIFMEDFGSTACRSDLDCDGTVTAIDFTFFSYHTDHSCAPTVTDVEEEEIDPRISALEQNYPNPFNPVTKIAFTVTEPGSVVLRVFDAAGRPIRTLADERMPASRYEVTWDGTDDHGRQVGSGVYFYRLEIAGEPETRKMVLLK